MAEYPEGEIRYAHTVSRECGGVARVAEMKLLKFELPHLRTMRPSMIVKIRMMISDITDRYEYFSWQLVRSGGLFLSSFNSRQKNKIFNAA